MHFYEKILWNLCAVVNTNTNTETVTLVHTQWATNVQRNVHIHIELITVAPAWSFLDIDAHLCRAFAHNHTAHGFSKISKQKNTNKQSKKSRLMNRQRLKCKITIDTKRATISDNCVRAQNKRMKRLPIWATIEMMWHDSGGWVLCLAAHAV